MRHLQPDRPRDRGEVAPAERHGGQDPRAGGTRGETATEAGQPSLDAEPPRARLVGAAAPRSTRDLPAPEQQARPVPWRPAVAVMARDSPSRSSNDGHPQPHGRGRAHLDRVGGRRDLVEALLAVGEAQLLADPRRAGRRAAGRRRCPRPSRRTPRRRPWSGAAARRCRAPEQPVVPRVAVDGVVAAARPQDVLAVAAVPEVAARAAGRQYSPAPPSSELESSVPDSTSAPAPGPPRSRWSAAQWASPPSPSGPSSARSTHADSCALRVAHRVAALAPVEQIPVRGPARIPVAQRVAVLAAEQHVAAAFPPPSSVLAITASTAMLSLPAPPSASSPTPWLLISSSMSPAATSVRRNRLGPPPALGPGLVHCAVRAWIGVQRPPVWIVAPRVRDPDRVVVDADDEQPVDLAGSRDIVRDGLVRGVARTGLGRQRRGVRGAGGEKGGGGGPRQAQGRGEAGTRPWRGGYARRGAGGPRRPPQADAWRRWSIVRSALRAHRCPRRRLPHAPWGLPGRIVPWHSRAMARLTAPPDWHPLRSAADWKEHRGGVLVVHQRNPLGNGGPGPSTTDATAPR